MTDRFAFHYAPDGYSTAGPRLLREHGYKGRAEWIAQDRPQDLERYGTLYHPTPAIERRVLERQAEYLGAQRFELPQLPLIPLWVHAADFDIEGARRDAVRRRLGIEPGDVAFLFFGRLSFHAKAHPQQMFAALGKAAQDGGRIHLVRDGVDGYRIPTVMPDAGAGLDLAQRYDDGADSYDAYCGHTSQAVALDGAALAQACARGIRLGRRVRALPLVVARARRTAPRRCATGAGAAGGRAGPARPVRVVRLVPVDADHADGDGRTRARRVARAVAPGPRTRDQPLRARVAADAGRVRTDLRVDRPTLLRGLAWLCKMDLLRIGAAEE